MDGSKRGVGNGWAGVCLSLMDGLGLVVRRRDGIREGHQASLFAWVHVGRADPLYICGEGGNAHLLHYWSVDVTVWLSM